MTNSGNHITSLLYRNKILKILYANSRTLARGEESAGGGWGGWNVAGVIRRQKAFHPIPNKWLLTETFNVCICSLVVFFSSESSACLIQYHASRYFRSSRYPLSLLLDSENLSKCRCCCSRTVSP